MDIVILSGAEAQAGQEHETGCQPLPKPSVASGEIRGSHFGKHCQFLLYHLSLLCLLFIRTSGRDFFLLLCPAAENRGHVCELSLVQVHDEDDGDISSLFTCVMPFSVRSSLQLRHDAHSTG